MAICMKCQNLFPGKISRKNISKCRLLQFLPSLLRVKAESLMIMVELTIYLTIYIYIYIFLFFFSFTSSRNGDCLPNVHLSSNVSSRLSDMCAKRRLKSTCVSFRYPFEETAFLAIQNAPNEDSDYTAQIKLI